MGNIGGRVAIETNIGCVSVCTGVTEETAVQERSAKYIEFELQRYSRWEEIPDFLDVIND